MTAAELLRLAQALSNYKDQQAANIIRLLLLTGAKSGETRAAKWHDIDLEAGLWNHEDAAAPKLTEQHTQAPVAGRPS